jgi:hypothetical protein
LPALVSPSQLLTQFGAVVGRGYYKNQRFHWLSFQGIPQVLTSN